MSKYNLIRNGAFSGSGDHSFTWADLELLQDGNTTSSGVTISGTNNLIVDLSQRIKVDGIRLYASDMSKSSNIHFYYKNGTSDSYTSLITSSGTYYSTTIPAPSAPRYVKVTISGVSMDLYEFQVFNDDYIVNFGENGQQYVEYIESTPIGEIGDPQAIPIYNNSENNMAATAYTCVEAVGSGYDNYIEISASENGPYYAIEDGAVIENDSLASTWRWSDGTLTDVEVNDQSNLEVSIGIGSKLNEIQSDVKTYNWYVTESAWDFDPISKKMYTSGSDGIYKLWEYHYENDTYTYIGELGGGTVTSEAWKGSMCVLNNKIYSIPESTQVFGCYDLSGPAGNWTTLSGHPHALSGDNARRVLCSDYSRYIYCIDVARHSLVRRFYRYDTTTSGWYSLDINYSYANSDNYSMSAHFVYDYDRDYIYFSHQNGGNMWNIQRYNVAADSWNTTYYNLTALKTSPAAGSYAAISYNNNTIWVAFSADKADDDIYGINLATGVTTRYTNISWELEHWGDGSGYANRSSYLIAIDALPGDTTSSHIFAGQVDLDRTRIFTFPSFDFCDYGSYTTPILKLEDKYNSSYFYIDGNTNSVSGSISYDADTYNGTIRVRSSDTEPVIIYESYLVYMENADIHIVSWSPYNDEYVDSEKWASSHRSTSPGAIAVDWQDGRSAICWGYGYYGYHENAIIEVYDREGSTLYSENTGIDYYYYFNDKLQFEGEHGLWGYGNVDSSNNRILKHLDEDLSVIASYSESLQDFLYDLATEYNGRGCWYTNSIDDTLVHMNSDCTKINTIIMNSPRSVARTTDGGCWVHDTEDEKVYRYDWSGNRIKTFDLPYNAMYQTHGLSFIIDDRRDGFWYRHGDIIRHVTSAGAVDVGPVTVVDSNQMFGSPIGCFVHSSDDNKMYWINMNGGIESYHSMPGGESTIISGFYYGYDEFEEFKEHYIPVSYDPVWGTGGSLEWQEVRKDGYFLPKTQYHQAEITLRGTAELEKIIIAPAVKVQDIQPKSSRNMYVRTNIPLEADISDYEIKLRTWWGIEDI